MDKLKTLLPYYVLLCASIAGIIYLFPVAHPIGGVLLPLDREAITRQAEALVKRLEIGRIDMRMSLELSADQSLIRQAQYSRGIARANTLLRDSLQGYRWKAQWSRKTHSDFHWSNDDNVQVRESDQTASPFTGDITLELDAHGSLLSLNREIPDTAFLPTLDEPHAKALAAQFLRTYGRLPGSNDTADLRSAKRTKHPSRTDYVFEWHRPPSPLGNPILGSIIIAGNIVAHYEQPEAVPERFRKEEKSTATEILRILFVLVPLVVLVWYFVKRIRAYEIGYRVAIAAGLLTALLFGLQIFLRISGTQPIWELLAAVIFGPIFVGGALVLLWAAGESAAREMWKEKLVSIDLLTNGYWFHGKIGESLIRGVSLGSGIFALSLLLIHVSGRIVPISFMPTEANGLHAFDASLPLLYAFTHSFYDAIFLFAFFFLFGISFLRKYVSSGLVLVAIGALVFCATRSGDVAPFIPACAIQFVLGIALVYVFYRHDAFTVFISLFILAAGPVIAGLFSAGNSSYTWDGILAAGFVAAVACAGTAMLFRKNEIEDYDSIMPAFAKHISERQRLQQELEIARTVQMSFLPKCDPSIPDFDICSRCAPALEVGGDYYDFIEMEDRRLAVVVGDVSGKGTQAAFFMTLTKGFIRALAHVSDSPAKALTQVNHLFYENVSRGIFISMIYGMFDMKRKVLTVARAGHNPVIMRKSHAAGVQIVNPAGLALGLDSGAKFVQSMEEVKVEYQPGDLFIFYTDGLTEAMNGKNEEYGEERLSKIVERLSLRPASEIVEGIYSELKSFAGKAPQHDDMTLVVVKVRE